MVSATIIVNIRTVLSDINQGEDIVYCLQGESLVTLWIMIFNR